MSQVALPSSRTDPTLASFLKIGVLTPTDQGEESQDDSKEPQPTKKDHSHRRSENLCVF